MAKTVNRIPLIAPVNTRKKRVAAYARVSAETDRLLHSLSAQVSYYNTLIQRTPDWEFAGIYVDQGITGTKLQARKEFRRLIADCEAGKIDIVLTKSLSRFARNTVDTLNVVRHLKALGVEVRFEKENINTLNDDGELLITLLSSFAQEESLSISENIKWSIKKRFEKGEFYNHARLLGYRWEGDQIIIVPEEAAIVRRIFADCIAGIGFMQMERDYAAAGFRSINGKEFKAAPLRSILTNVMYTGNLELQKAYIVDPIGKKKRKNNGELPKYYVEGTHEAIISRETFDLAQAELARRAEERRSTIKPAERACFSGKVKCSCHGTSFVKAKHPNTRPDAEPTIYWTCAINKKSGEHCDTKLIPDSVLRTVCARVLKLDSFDEKVFDDRVQQIVASEPRHLCFMMSNGAIVETDWEPRSRHDYWTPEQRAIVSARRSDPLISGPGKYDFSKYLVCKHCGQHYVSQPCKKKDALPGERLWQCRHEQTDCPRFFMRDSMLHTVIAEAMGTANFDLNAFRDKVHHVDVLSPMEIEIVFKDGSTVKHPITPNHTTTTEKEAFHGEESNNDTANPDPVYGRANHR